MSRSGLHPNSRAAVSESNRRRAAARAAERLTPRPVVVEGSLVAQARAERGTGKPLAVESLEQRLARCLPGAICFRERHEWVVCRLSALHRHNLARAVSEREAIDVAILLHGGGR